MIRTEAEAREIAASITKHTEVAARVDRQPVSRGKAQRQKWVAEYGRGINDQIYLRRARRLPGGKWLAGNDIPAPVREFLGVTGPRGLTFLTRDEFDNLASLEAVVSSRSVALDALRRQATVNVEFTETGPSKVGIALFCEVGDSGSGPTDFLPLPVSQRKLDEALDAIVSYARDLAIEGGWDEGEDSE